VNRGSIFARVVSAAQGGKNHSRRWLGSGRTATTTTGSALRHGRKSFDGLYPPLGVELCLPRRLRCRFLLFLLGQVDLLHSRQALRHQFCVDLLCGWDPHAVDGRGR
jgi:hypothetical protein